ncbi:hypothetical protein Bca4012_042502 [Brassica carinata]|uniref:Uncharacterized protein n=2 Tax=Brassica TaxID=3705 RepID=A0A8X7UFW6_BRACI|nr:hypothetical protein Bca52824_059772 [Brassica carinata]
MTSQLLWTNTHLLFQTFNHQWDGQTIYLSSTSYPPAANAKSKPRKHAMAFERQSFQDERERRCVKDIFLGNQRKTRRSRLLKVAFLFWKGREELLRDQLRVASRKASN